MADTFEVTADPTAAWVWRQLIEATPWGPRPTYLIHDRDRVWGADLPTRAAGLGIKSIRIPVRAPRANAVGERIVGTLRRECLDHLIVFGERHLRAVVSEFVAYYNRDRSHRALELGTPILTAHPASGAIRSRPVLGGLHHVYERAA